MGVAVLTLVAVMVMKAVAGKIYEDCKVGIWLAVIAVVFLTGMVITAIFEKIALIPVLLLL